MKKFSVDPRQAAAIGLTLALVCVPLALAGAYVVQQHQRTQADLDQLEPRYARLLGLENSRDALQQAETQAQAALEQHAYAASQDISQAGNDAQQRIRQTFSQAGMTVTSSQVLTPTQEKQFDRIPLALRAEGGLIAMQSALLVLSTQKPTVLVDEINVQVVGSGRTGDPSQRLVLQMRLAVLRVRS